MAKDHHDEPYDSGSLLKLELFEEYITSWIPVFIQQDKIETIAIYDFFAGPGLDKKEEFGSPLRIANIVNNKYGNMLRRKGKKVTAYFSDISEEKIENLAKRLAPYQSNCFQSVVQPRDFYVAYDEHISSMRLPNRANLVLLDPMGFTWLPEHIQELSTIPRTDWLAFIPSDYIVRFRSMPCIQNKWPGLELIDMDCKSATGKISDHLKANYLEPDYLVAHFGLKKPTGKIHGVLFGSKCWLGLEKFVDTCWKLDPKNGIGFDLEGDISTQHQMALPIITPGSRLRQFNSSFEELILSGKIRNTEAAYKATLEAGFKLEQARDVLNSLKKKKQIKLLDDKGHTIPRLSLSYNSVHKIKKILTFEKT